MNGDALTWTVLETADAVAQATCQRILDRAGTAIRERGHFHLVLAGGTTPRHAYERLAKADADWANWFIWFGDERCLPADDPERNSVMAAQTLLNKVAIPAHQVFPMAAERGAEAAAEDYRQSLAGQPPFDLVLLGMGEDGHTASLFPGHRHDSGLTVVAVHDAPKPPPDRVSLSAQTLSNSREVLFIVTGAGKQQAVTGWRNGEHLPIATIHCPGRNEVLIDRPAIPSRPTR